MYQEGEETTKKIKVEEEEEEEEEEEKKKKTTCLILENLNVAIKRGIFFKVITRSSHIGPKFRKKLVASSTGRNSAMYL